MDKVQKRNSFNSQYSFLRNPQSMFLPQSERPSFALIQYNWQNYSFIYIYIFQSLVLLIWDGKTKDSGLNNSKHSLNLIYSLFHHECHSDLLVSSSSIYLNFATFSNNSLAILIF
jgi:hypothetical protein